MRSCTAPVARGASQDHQIWLSENEELGERSRATPKRAMHQDLVELLPLPKGFQGVCKAQREAHVKLPWLLC